jgi:hypothetical protein
MMEEKVQFNSVLNLVIEEVNKYKQEIIANGKIEGSRESALSKKARDIKNELHQQRSLANFKVL